MACIKRKASNTQQNKKYQAVQKHQLKLNTATANVISHLQDFAQKMHKISHRELSQLMHPSRPSENSVINTENAHVCLSLHEDCTF